MISRYDVITTWIAPWDTHFVEPIVFGTTDPHQIAWLIDTSCQKELGTTVADYLFYESSVGAVCGVCLVDGRRVVVKIDQPSCPLDFLQSVVRVQHYLIYDWDSLAYEKEPSIVGHASGYFTYTEFFGESRLPTDEEAHAFVAEYEAARGRPFTVEEHQTLKAAKIYGIAYAARCEHALNPNEITYPEGSCRSFLAQYKSRRHIPSPRCSKFKPTFGACYEENMH